MTWLYITGYVLGYIATWPKAFLFFMDDAGPWPDNTDTAFAAFTSTLWSFLWPIIVICVMSWRVVQPLLLMLHDYHKSKRGHHG